MCEQAPSWKMFHQNFYLFKKSKLLLTLSFLYLARPSKLQALKIRMFYKRSVEVHCLLCFCFVLKNSNKFVSSLLLIYHHYHQFIPVVSSLPLIYSRLLFGFLEDSWKSNFQTFHFKQVLHLINIAATLNVMNKNLDLLWSIKLYEHINITDS